MARRLEHAERVEQPLPADVPSVQRVRFVAGAGARAGDIVVGHFEHPRRASAVLEALEPTSGAVPADTSSEGFRVVFVPEGCGDAELAAARRMLAEELPRLVARHGLELVEWWPGRALVTGTRQGSPFSAVVQFSFIESELRALERLVSEHEARAESELDPAHHVSQRDRRRWPALFDGLRHVTAARLRFARLEPQLYELSSVPPAGRRWLERLFEVSGSEDRAEALSDRLEALESFYEAAVQRVSDFRWYREGRLLETAILVMLVLECLLMLGDLYLHARP